MMRRWLLSIFVIWCAVTSLSAQEPVQKDTLFQVEVIHELTVYDMWHSFFNSDFRAKKAPFLAHWTYDEESAPSDPSKGVAIGIVMFGNGDIGETPVGVRIWSRRPARIVSISEQPERSAAGENGYVLSIRESNCASADCAVGEFVFRATETEVFFEGRVIGVIE